MLQAYRLRREQTLVKMTDKYEILGFISSGTYGRVYKARSRNKADKEEYAIKQFKSEKEGETIMTTGISQSACREIALCRELQHDNVVKLYEVILEDKCLNMVLGYTEYDLLQITHHHHQIMRAPIPDFIIKSFLWQLLNGMVYLHSNWVLHRDLKPANILITSEGIIKVGDLGLARIFQRPLQPLYNGDKVVVTVWYRAPELLLGARHYTKAIDLWAIGCIFAEMMALRPIFKGEEAKMDQKKGVPFQKNQLTKIFELLGNPTQERWPKINALPDYSHLSGFRTYQNSLKSWFQNIPKKYPESAFNLLSALLEYDPERRITAEDALNHQYFQEEPKPALRCLSVQNASYPKRRIVTEDSRDPNMNKAKVK
ncbi:kinase-like domain-containing protein [Dimargaris cristalligena]|uniref:Cyclin-dependent kinase 8 n=1 Tax=Dimargaris cristalligena TaxID=215637 RepID=A0A4P9ZVV0_9FUNG|nr:kinase-like domain-containing protein [Dimargaris cristalligena]|eukprot:RKP37408.1 kinase-like domain-containing protein [Dimargaris cristalligena]